MDDLISREAVLDMQAKYAEHMGATTFWQMRDDIKTLSSIKPQSYEDAISRQAVLDLPKLKTHNTWGEAIYESVDIKDVKQLPPVKPQEPKTGYWVEETVNEWGHKVYCSECGGSPPFEHIDSGDVYSASGYGVINKIKFCPNCGAKMVKLQKSEEQKMTELKPCPFCGSEAKYKKEKDHQYNYYTELVVGCTNSHCFCRTRTSLGVAPSEYLIKTQMDKMIEKWNKRIIETTEK